MKSITDFTLLRPSRWPHFSPVAGGPDRARRSAHPERRRGGHGRGGGDRQVPQLPRRHRRQCRKDLRRLGVEPPRELRQLVRTRMENKAYWDKLYKKAGELFGTENITIPA